MKINFKIFENPSDTFTNRHFFKFTELNSECHFSFRLENSLKYGRVRYMDHKNKFWNMFFDEIKNL